MLIQTVFYLRRYCELYFNFMKHSIHALFLIYNLYIKIILIGSVNEFTAHSRYNLGFAAK